MGMEKLPQKEGITPENGQDSKNLACSLKMPEKKERAFVSKWIHWFIDISEAYGGEIVYYGAAGLGILAAAVSCFVNDYQGGCKYPYVSEISRAGIGWVLFSYGCFWSCISWILFSNHFYKIWTICRMNLPVFSSRQHSGYFWNNVFYFTNVLGAVGLACTGYFDMGFYPMTHEYSVALFVVGTFLTQLINIAFLLRYFRSLFSTGYIVYKFFLLCLFFFGILAFVELGSIEECKSRVISMSECLIETSEHICFRYMSPEDPEYTVIRKYSNCLTMHWWRGSSEFYTVLAGVETIRSLVYDRDCILNNIIKTTNNCPIENRMIIQMQRDRDEEINNMFLPEPAVEDSEGTTYIIRMPDDDGIEMTTVPSQLHHPETPSSTIR